MLLEIIEKNGTKVRLGLAKGKIIFFKNSLNFYIL